MGALGEYPHRDSEVENFLSIKNNRSSAAFNLLLKVYLKGLATNLS